MVAAALHGLSHGLPGFAPGLSAVEETEVLAPGDVHEDADALFIGQPKEPVGRGVIGADGVDADGRHAGEVVEYAPGVGELFAVGVGGEGAVGDAVDAQPSAVAGEELSVHAQAPRRDGHVSVAGESFAGFAFGRPDHYGHVVHSHRPRE